MNKAELTLVAQPAGEQHETIAQRTRWIYDHVSFIYPLSTMFFHSRAHRCAMEMSGIRDGMTVLEIATGSGEMFRRIVGANKSGRSVGIDLSPNMAAHTQRRINREFPQSRAHCQAVDARYLPFADESFDAVVCCFMLELLGSEDIFTSLHEIRRVLRDKGTFTLVLIGENTETFNRLYRVAGAIAPAFWGRQVENTVPEMMEAVRFRITGERQVRQTGYPSRVLTAKK